MIITNRGVTRDVKHPSRVGYFLCPAVFVLMYDETRRVFWFWR